MERKRQDQEDFKIQELSSHILNLKSFSQVPMVEESMLLKDLIQLDQSLHSIRFKLQDLARFLAATDLKVRDCMTSIDMLSSRIVIENQEKVGSSLWKK